MESARVMLIMDDEVLAKYLREKLIVDAGHTVSWVRQPQEGLEELKHNGFDIIIAKFDASVVEDKELIWAFKKSDPDVIIIAFLDDTKSALARELLHLGVYEFMERPLNLEKLFFLVKKGSQLHSLNVTQRKLVAGLQERNQALQKQNILLAKRIEESTDNLTRLYEDLRLTYMRTIKVLAQTIDARDHYTHSHSQNVVKYAVAIAEELGLSAKEIEIIREACELHDLGKIGVQDSILAKPSSLTPEEWEQIKSHPGIGAQILEPLTFLNGVVDLIKQHHERYDGSGYPQGIKGEDILLGARIIHLADAYEAMRSPRAYRKEPLGKEEALREIKNNSGGQFDPRVVAAFLKVVDRL